MSKSKLGLLDRVRFRLCMVLMPKLLIAEEKRRLAVVARGECGVSRAMANKLASAYFNSLKK